MPTRSTASTSAIGSSEAEETEIQTSSPDPSQDDVNEDEEPPKRPERKREKTKSRREPGILRGLVSENIISIDDHLPPADRPPSSTLSSNRRYATREMINGPAIALYDQKYHPMDDEMHKGRARAHRRRSAFAQTDKSFDLVLLDEKRDASGDSDDNTSDTLSLGSDDEDMSPSQIKRLERTTEHPGTRRSERHHNARPLYNLKVHPLDKALRKLYDGNNPHFEDDREPPIKRRKSSTPTTAKSTTSSKVSSKKGKAKKPKASTQPNPQKSGSTQLMSSTQTRSSPLVVYSSSESSDDSDSDDDVDDDDDEDQQEPNPDLELDETIDGADKALQPDLVRKEGRAQKKGRKIDDGQEQEVDDDALLDALDNDVSPKQKPQPVAVMQVKNRTPSDTSSRTVSGGSSVTICEDPKDADRSTRPTDPRQIISQKDRDALDDPKENSNPNLNDAAGTVNPRDLMLNGSNGT